MIPPTDYVRFRTNPKPEAPAAGFLDMYFDTEDGVLKTRDANGNEASVGGGGDVLATLEADPGAAREAMGVQFSPVYFDDFQRADTASNALGAARSGHTYNVNGSGAASARIIRGGLDRVSPRGTIYVDFELEEPAEIFGTEFSLTSNPGGGTSAFFAMIMSSTRGGLNPMFHFVFTQTALAVEWWPVTGEPDKTVYLAHTFANPLRLDGTPYILEFEFLPLREQLIVYLPDGNPPAILSVPGMADKMSKYLTIEIGGGDTAVWYGRFENAWAWSPSEDREDWQAAARAKSAARAIPSPLINPNTGVISAAYLPLPVAALLPRGHFPMNIAAGAVTTVSTGSGTPNAAWWSLSSGATASSSALWRANSTSFFLFSRGPNQFGVDFAKPVVLAYGGQITVTAGGTARIQLGRVTAETTIKNLDVAGIGFLLTGGSIYLEKHDGTTRTVSTAIGSYTAGVATNVTLVARAYQGSVAVWVNDVLVGTFTGAPVTQTSINNAGLVASVENAVTAAASSINFQPNSLVVNVGTIPV